MSELTTGGWFIPHALVIDYGLSFIDAALWSDIKWWTERDGCCRRSIDELAAPLHVSRRNLTKMLGRLRDAGLIRDISFDGRVKTIVAVDPKD